MRINSNIPLENQPLYQKDKLEADDFKETLEKAAADGDEKKLKAACQQFESIFLQMVLKGMRSTIVEDGLVEKSYGREIFEGMYDEKLSEEMVKGQGVGLADQLYKQLSKQNRER
jgi:flagellar protein FlgJ